MRLNLPSIMAAMFVLAACTTAPEEASDAGGTGGEVTSAQSSAPDVAAAPTGPQPGSQADLVANIGDRVFFDFDKHSLKPDARATVERWSAWLKTYPQVTVTIEGHADERGTREYNLALGERRANAALEYMQSLGIDSSRVRVISFGKERPAVPGSTDSAYLQNRRSVLVVN